QVRRMLADERARTLATDFAVQWLHLRNLDSITPDLRLFPDFDDNLRKAFRKETELFFESVVREDRSVLELLKADYTFLNERLAEHRANAACASCHRVIDPVGFSLEQFDAVGRWRTLEEGRPVDAAGGLPDGSEFTGVAGLEKALLQRPEWFVRTLTEKLFTFALGRPPEESDAPAIRQIVREARASNYRVSALIVGLTSSTPFQMRKSQ